MSDMALCGEILAKHCAPTLADLKLANMFVHNGNDALNHVRIMNSMLKSSGIKSVILRKNPGGYLLYVYRTEKLTEILSQKDIREFLYRYGYRFETSDAAIMKLKERLKSDEFPHEIGIFLGYPLEDVKQFIKNKGKNYKLSGTWKVYDDVDKCEKLFKKFKESTRVFMHAVTAGDSILKLCNERGFY